MSSPPSKVTDCAFPLSLRKTVLAIGTRNDSPFRHDAVFEEEGRPLLSAHELQAQVVHVGEAD